ncbi:MAG: ATP-dependent Clp protease ATP-binding subunit ClpA [Candidatus Aminicenantes bacterium]|nr:ATP-dependent Clp protease ATP-binding subunit ClpA [Candidatus Aminicenantes bacterium]
MKISQSLTAVLSAAFNEARTRHHEYMTPEHVLYASLFFEEGQAIIENSGGNVDGLQRSLQEFLDSPRIPRLQEGDPGQSEGFQNVMENAILHVASAQKSELELGDVFAAFFMEEDSYTVFFLQRQGITRLSVLTFLAGGGSESEPEPRIGEVEDEVGPDSRPETRGKKERFLEQFAVDLTQRAVDGKLDPVIGREEIIERTLQVLSRRRKNNPLHVGDSGVGKTAVTEGLAMRIAAGKVPGPLKHARIFSLDMGGILAGTRYRGDFEDRFKKCLAELMEIEGALLFIDEIHTLVGAGAVSGGSMDAANLLKPALMTGKLRCIGCTTHEEYRKHFDKDRALSRRFQKIDVPEPSTAETMDILTGLKDRYQDHHGVIYTMASLEAAVELSHQYINDRRLPDKAIDVMDEAGARVRMANFQRSRARTRIVRKDVEAVVAAMARIPERTVSITETRRLEFLEATLRRSVFGQDQAVAAVVEAVKRARAGFREAEKPVASMLFAGPTGVGKTELARRLAEALGVQLLRFDMSEYQEKHTVARLIGAPPGYVGYEEGGLLTDAIRRSPHAVLLLDEIEKAHADIYNTLLQIMDHATLTDNAGKPADFRNIILIMTSNVGARNLDRTQIGFGDRVVSGQSVHKAVSVHFTPEFRNRLDATVLFERLNQEVVERIVLKNIDEFRSQLRRRRIHLEVSDDCVRWLARHGYSKLFGAREVARLIDQKLKPFFVNEALFGRLSRGGRARAELDGDDVKVSIIASPSGRE